MQHIKAGKVDVATIHAVDGSGFRQDISRANAGRHPSRSRMLRARAAVSVRPPPWCGQCAHGKPTGTERWRRSPGRRRYWSGPTPVLRRLHVLAMSRWANAAWPTPVAPFVGIGQASSAGPAGKAHVIEFRCVDREAGLDVAQAQGRSAGRRPWTGLLGAGKRPDPVIAAIPVADPREIVHPRSPWPSEQLAVFRHLLGQCSVEKLHEPPQSSSPCIFDLQTPHETIWSQSQHRSVNRTPGIHYNIILYSLYSILL